MGKISIVSRRRRGNRFPDTEAQQRARVRELSSPDLSLTLRTEAGEALAGEGEITAYSEALLDDLVATAIPEVTSALQGLADNLTEILSPPQESAIRLELNPEQSQAISTLTLLANAQNQPLLLDLQEWHDQQHIVLQFSLHTNAVPEMLSLKDLCGQLKVGRRSVMRLMREGKLRGYRIGNRYRFAASEIKHYLEQSSSQEL